MATEFQETLFGQIIAQNLLLRGLWAQWAAEQRDPVAWNRQTISALIESMKMAPAPSDEQEARLYGYARNALHEFGEQVDIRLRGLLQHA